MKFKISTQMSPFSRTAAEVIKFVDIDKHLSSTEVDAEAEKLEQRFKGNRIGDSGSLTLRKGTQLDTTVIVRVAELSEDEHATLIAKDIDARRHASGYTYGEWELISKGGPGRTDWTRGTRHAETASVYALPILDADNQEVDRLIHSSGMGTDEVKHHTARRMFEKWLDEQLYADDPEKLLELFWDDDYPYAALLHRPECLPNLERYRKRRFEKLDADGAFAWDIEGEIVQIPIETCEGCEPLPPPSEDDVAF